MQVGEGDVLVLYSCHIPDNPSAHLTDVRYHWLSQIGTCPFSWSIPSSLYYAKGEPGMYDE